MVLGLVKFGFVGTYLSEPLVRAYTTAAAAHAVVAQLKYMFGVSPTRFSGPLALIYVSTIKITFYFFVFRLQENAQTCKKSVLSRSH